MANAAAGLLDKLRRSGFGGPTTTTFDENEGPAAPGIRGTLAGPSAVKTPEIPDFEGENRGLPESRPGGVFQPGERLQGPIDEDPVMNVASMLQDPGRGGPQIRTSSTPMDGPAPKQFRARIREKMLLGSRSKGMSGRHEDELFGGGY